ncbi:MAG TPA: hypothetical protein VKT30_02715 [Caulobacteraceae bacterium]|nr:hypothetical protein [Caulobacteraceae bacterium]
MKSLSPAALAAASLVFAGPALAATPPPAGGAPATPPTAAPTTPPPAPSTAGAPTTTPPADSTAGAPSATAAGVNASVTVGMPVKDNTGAQIGQVSAVGPDSSGKTMATVKMGAQVFSVDASVLAVAGGAATINATKAQIEAQLPKK